MCVCRAKWRRSARADIMITIMIYMTRKESREQKRKQKENKLKSRRSNGYNPQIPRRPSNTHIENTIKVNNNYKQQQKIQLGTTLQLIITITVLMLKTARRLYKGKISMPQAPQATTYLL